MRGSESYEWLLDSCLQECRKGISRLEQIAAGGEEKRAWLQEDLHELLALEAAAVESFAHLKRTSDVSEHDRNLAQEKLDRLQAKLLESFHHLAGENVAASSCR
ncbi:MAG TPA: hypothetical protein PL151_04380 [Phycisphaerae bacterium]|nr:hypothetical protein [Phycisphaerae bacterium]HOJ72464.1 hypothetical protein [Phycisphaerae bacterium]HOM49874.1 hypothetical protein [Phycisphaerae bacterium]HON65484.1 hypothetical protein [Phycisphaerae bacterium]HOQ84712.1 hypothetical protein [Phycisphaerae bacterium]